MEEIINTINYSNITLNNFDYIIYNEFDLIKDYCLNMGTVFNNIIIMIFILWVLIEIIDIFSNHKILLKETYFNLLILPFCYIVPKILIQENYISENGLIILQWILIFIFIVIGFYLYSTGKFDRIIKKIKNLKI